MHQVILTLTMEDFQMLDKAIAASSAPFCDVNILVAKVFKQFNEQAAADRTGNPIRVTGDVSGAFEKAKMEDSVDE